MQDIASQYTVEQEKRVYQNAVNRFRLPFWDPFLPRNKLNSSTDPIEGIWGVPKILAAKDVWVKRPNPRGSAEVKSIPNPLYQFTFPSKDTLRSKKRDPVDFDDTSVVSHHLPALLLNENQSNFVSVEAGQIIHYSDAWPEWWNQYLWRRTERQGGAGPQDSTAGDRLKYQALEASE